MDNITKRLAESLEKSIECMQRIYDGTMDCGSYDSECPLQDASSNDEWSLLSRLKTAKQALEEYIKEKKC